MIDIDISTRRPPVTIAGVAHRNPKSNCHLVTIQQPRGNHIRVPRCYTVGCSNLRARTGSGARASEVTLKSLHHSAGEAMWYRQGYSGVVEFCWGGCRFLTLSPTGIRPRHPLLPTAAGMCPPVDEVSPPGTSGAARTLPVSHSQLLMSRTLGETE